MIKKLCIAACGVVLFLLFVHPQEIRAQNHNWEGFLSITTSGGGAGAKFRWDVRSKWMKTISLQMGGVRGEKEFVTFDYYYGYPNKINQERYIVLTPLFFGIQRVILQDAIENNVKPYIIVEAGPVLGAWFPVGHGLGGNIKRGTTGLTLGGFIGAGVEIGSAKANSFTLAAGFRSIYFPDPLGDDRAGEKRFNAFVVQFGVTF